MTEYAHVFDEVADEYARERPSYPEELVDRACAGARSALEVGCGTGQLTASLLARGLSVHALDRAPNMLRRARSACSGATFERVRFEDYEPRRRYDAVFSASAFHWLDPQVSWAKAAQVLEPGGRIALIQYVSAAGEETAAHDEALAAALARIAPEIFARWPQPRDLASLRAGIPGNVSEVWAWVTGKPLAIPETAFGPPQIAAVPVIRERTADELEALFATTSLCFQLGDQRSRAFAAENRRVVEQLGGTVRTTEVAVLVTAAFGG
jgi:SAM-dependent methyltransferase